MTAGRPHPAAGETDPGQAGRGDWDSDDQPDVLELVAAAIADCFEDPATEERLS